MNGDFQQSTIGAICGCDNYFDEGCPSCTPAGDLLPPWTDEEKAEFRAQALRLDLKAAVRLLREHGYTVTEPAND